MNFLQVIYFNDKRLIIATSNEPLIDHYVATLNYTLFNGATKKNFKSAIQHLQEPTSVGGVITDFSKEVLLENLYKNYELVEAGGGAVHNENQELLMIHRRGKWDLPKGKLDLNELITDCAVREVKEETGLMHVTLLDKIMDTYHIYASGKDYLLKRSSWYYMQASGTEILLPQAEEQIAEVKWVKREHIANYSNHTYEAIKDVLKAIGWI